jgi:hypothetical protein
MSDAPKSAWEIALEKLQKQDRDSGAAGPVALTADQKKEIAALRQRAQAKLAEAEILHNDHRRKAIEDPEALAKVEEEYRIERRRIDEQRDREIDRVRRGEKKASSARASDASETSRGKGKEKRKKRR